MSVSSLNYNTYEISQNADTHHIIWNLLLTDKLVKLTPELVERNKIRTIMAILPDKSEYAELAKEIPDVENYVYEYGHVHDMNTDYAEYDYMSQKIDYVAKNAKENEYRNVLLFCNNGYQRSLPFITYYLTRYHADEFDSINKAVKYVLMTLDRDNYNSIVDAQVENITKILDKK